MSGNAHMTHMHPFTTQRKLFGLGSLLASLLFLALVAASPARAQCPQPAQTFGICQFST
jgi:hypothetical protein